MIDRALILRPGPNPFTGAEISGRRCDGLLIFDDAAARKLTHYCGRVLPITLDHSRRRVGSFRIEIRDGELWAVDMAISRRRSGSAARYLSPDFPRLREVAAYCWRPIEIAGLALVERPSIARLRDCAIE